MNRTGKLLIMLAMAVLLLTGCNMTTVDELYCLPKRSEEHTDLQILIDEAMVNLEYSAPLSGENQQTVQTVDLDGDGEQEYILFAKGSTDKPLQIFIFGSQGDTYVLRDTIESTGSAFDQVEYAQMNDQPGYEIIVGRQVSDQVVRSVCVYTMVGQQMEQVMSASYTKFLCYDLDVDFRSELFILRPGESDAQNGIVELYDIEYGNLERSHEVSMSRPADAVKRIMISRVNDGLRAVYVASDVDGSALITDVFAIVDDELTNVSFSNESGTSVQTLRNYYVYADDIDDDGILELPDLISMKLPEQTNSDTSQYLIRWYAMTSTGAEVDKLYTYHNYVGGWYLQLPNEISYRFTVAQKGNSYEFSLWNEYFSQSEKLMTIYVLTGQKREEQAVADNRFVLYRTDSTIYAADLEVASAAYGMTRESLSASFRLIIQDWNTGVT